MLKIIKCLQIDSPFLALKLLLLIFYNWVPPSERTCPDVVQVRLVCHSSALEGWLLESKVCQGHAMIPYLPIISLPVGLLTMQPGLFWDLIVNTTTAEKTNIVARWVTIYLKRHFINVSNIREWKNDQRKKTCLWPILLINAMNTVDKVKEEYYRNNIRQKVGVHKSPIVTFVLLPHKYRRTNLKYI